MMIMATEYDTTKDGGLEKPIINVTLADRIKMFVRLYGFIQCLLPIFLLRIVTKKDGFPLSGFVQLYTLVAAGHNDPIDMKPSEMLISKVWALASAKHYLGRLEWQVREGYCAPATMRCILKSFTSFPTHLLPEQVLGPSDIEQWCEKLEKLTQESKDQDLPKFKTEIIRGDVEYELFLQKLREALSQSNCRVAINFLRPSLVGFKKPWWVPLHFLFGLMSGHFSPILGMLESTSPEKPPLVAVFDVNAAYGMILVEAPRLYQAAKACDVVAGKSRGIIIVSETTE